ncbi:MAG: hypothetical protein AAFO63_05095 [Pseudomonadota bacterium]
MPKLYITACVAAFLTIPMSAAQSGLPVTHSPATILASEPIECVAVFELVERKLPYQLRESEMRLARQVWQLRAGKVTQYTQIDLGTQINHHMAVLKAEYNEDPNRLAQAADECRQALKNSSANRF